MAGRGRPGGGGQMLKIVCTSAENVDLAFYQNAVPILRA